MNAGAAAGRAGRWRGGIVFIRGFWTIVLAGGGRIVVAICDQADKLDHTARSPTSTTQQSTNVYGRGRGLDGPGDGAPISAYQASNCPVTTHR